jgi:hypothetical protein
MPHPLPAPQPRNWRWVAKYPSRPDAGYHLTQLYSATLTANEVAQLYLNALRSPNRMERFHNSILGLPYTGGDRQPIHPDKLLYHAFESPILNPSPPSLHRRRCRRHTAHDLLRDALHHRHRAVHGRNQMARPRKPHSRAPTKSRRRQRHALQRLRKRPACANSKNISIGGAIIYDAGDESKPTVGYEDEEFGEPVRRISYPRTELMDGTVSALLRGEILLPPKHKPQTALLVKHLMNYITERDEQGRRRLRTRARRPPRTRPRLRTHPRSARLRAPTRCPQLRQTRATWLVKESVVRRTTTLTAS